MTMTVVWRKSMKENVNLFKTGNKFIDQEGDIHEFLHFCDCRWIDKCLNCSGKIAYIDGEDGTIQYQCFGVTSGVDREILLLIKEVEERNNYFQDDEFLI